MATLAPVQALLHRLVARVYAPLAGNQTPIWKRVAEGSPPRSCLERVPRPPARWYAPPGEAPGGADLRPYYIVPGPVAGSSGEAPEDPRRLAHLRDTHMLAAGALRNTHVLTIPAKP